jgi:hypothetical protein
MNLFRAISNAIDERRKRVQAKQDFYACIMRTAKNGTLTETELEGLRARYKELNLSPTDSWGIGVRTEAYKMAFQAIVAKGTISAEDEAKLVRTQTFLMIPDADIVKERSMIYRMRVLAEIQKGNLPSVTIPNLVLQKDESAYWAEPASILEDRVVNRRYEGSSQGVSLRIAKGVSYRIGAQRGHLVADRATVPVSSGSVIVTNKRLIFAGDAKSLSLRLNKLLEVHCYSNGVRFSEENGKGHLIRFLSADNIDIVAAILSHAINEFKSA